MNPTHPDLGVCEHIKASPDSDNLWTGDLERFCEQINNLLLSVEASKAFRKFKEDCKTFQLINGDRWLLDIFVLIEYPGFMTSPRKGNWTIVEGYDLFFGEKQTSSPQRRRKKA